MSAISKVSGANFVFGLAAVVSLVSGFRVFHLCTKSKNAKLRDLSFIAAVAPVLFAFIALVPYKIGETSGDLHVIATRVMVLSMFAFAASFAWRDKKALGWLMVGVMLFGLALMGLRLNISPWLGQCFWGKSFLLVRGLGGLTFISTA